MAAKDLLSEPVAEVALGSIAGLVTGGGANDPPAGLAGLADADPRPAGLRATSDVPLEAADSAAEPRKCGGGGGPRNGPMPPKGGAEAPRYLSLKLASSEESTGPGEPLSVGSPGTPALVA